MADTEGLRDRLTRQGEDALGRLAQGALENPVVVGAVTRAFEARERAIQAQGVALSALNLPSAADLERLTRRLRSVSQRLEGLEESVDRLDRRLEGFAAPADADARAAGSADDRLAAMEAQLGKLATEVANLAAGLDAGPPPVPREQERLEVESGPEAPTADRRRPRRSTTA